MKERFRFPGIVSPLGPESKDGKINTVRNVNDFTIVVQEYFQKRIKNCLNTVGKTIFEISHHWTRFEFAPSRGQIHAHMLAVTGHNSLLQKAIDVYKSIPKMEAFLADWMQKSSKMTSELPDLSEDEMKANVQILYSGREHKEKTENWK